MSPKKGDFDVELSHVPDDGIVTVEATRDYSERGLYLQKGARAQMPVERVKQILKEHQYPTVEIETEGRAAGNPKVVKGSDGKPMLREMTAEAPIKVVEASPAEAKELRVYHNRMMKTRDIRDLKAQKEHDELAAYASKKG